ncbi:hypothetical protein EUTSA_v10001224mg, partial [Eutrema salsugineum]
RFKELESIVNSPSPGVPLKQFSDACSHFSNLFGVLEIAFKYVKINFVRQVDEFAKASSTTSTLQAMVEKDIEAGQAKKYESLTRKLLRLKRALEMARVLFEEIIATQPDSSLKDAVFKAYSQVLAPHHGHALQESASSGFVFLPSRAELLLMINETEETAKVHMQSYVTASKSVTEYLDKFYQSKNLDIDFP